MKKFEKIKKFFENPLVFFPTVFVVGSLIIGGIIYFFNHI